MRNAGGLIAVCCGILMSVICVESQADYSGDMRMVQGRRSEPVTGRIFAKRTKQRMDMRLKGQSMSVIMDMGTQEGYVLDHDHQMAMTANARDYGGAVPRCTHGDSGRCLSENGFRTAGQEAIDGHACTIYQKVDNTDRAHPMMVRVWRPTDMGDVAFLRVESKNQRTSELVARIDLSNVRVGPVEDSKFVVPASYRKIEIPAGFMKGMGRPGAGGKGMPSREELLRAVGGEGD